LKHHETLQRNVTSIRRTWAARQLRKCAATAATYGF